MLFVSFPFPSALSIASVSGRYGGLLPPPGLLLRQMALRSVFSRKPSAAPPFLWQYRSSPYYISLVTGECGP